MEHGGVNIEEEGNALVENTIANVGIGATNNVPENKIEEDVTGAIDEDDEEDDSGTCNDDYDEENFDILLIEKAYEPLYQGSQTMLLSTVLFLVKFKVMNGISNVGISHMLRYSIIFSSFMLAYH